MALVIESGSGTDPAANSYASEAQLQEYAANRGITLTGDPSQLLLRAADYTESLAGAYAGRRVHQDQPLQWPRTGAVIDGYYASTDAIPGALVRAQIVTAIAIDEGRDPMMAIEPGITEETVGPLSVSYSDSQAGPVINVDIKRAFAPLLRGGVGGNQVPVYRG